MRCRRCPVLAECRQLSLTVERPTNPNVQSSPPQRVRVCPILWVIHRSVQELKTEESGRVGEQGQRP